MSTSKRDTVTPNDPLPIKVADNILIGSINNNTIDWQLQKTIESLLELTRLLAQYKKGSFEEQPTDIHIAKGMADVYIQLGIMNHLIAVPLTQQFINDRLTSIRNRNLRLGTPKFKRKVGFNIDERPE